MRALRLLGIFLFFGCTRGTTGTASQLADSALDADGATVNAQVDPSPPSGECGDARGHVGGMVGAEAICVRIDLKTGTVGPHRHSLRGNAGARTVKLEKREVIPLTHGTVHFEFGRKQAQDFTSSITAVIQQIGAEPKRATFDGPYADFSNVTMLERDGFLELTIHFGHLD